MKRTYELEMDFPHTGLEEVGWAKSRLLRGIAPKNTLNTGSMCLLEPRTGTLMLRPHNLDPVKWYDSGTDPLRLSASEMIVQPGYWRSEQQVQNLIGGVAAGSHEWQHTGPLTLLQLLRIYAASEIKSAIVKAGKELVPILATSADYPANQGWHIDLVTYGYPGTMAENYMAIRFGDFLLNLHTDGGADLYWSSDGSGDSDKWIRRKQFDEFGGNPKGMTSNTMGCGPGAVFSLYIIPFGRGNILFMIKSLGKTFSDVYHHPYATEVGGNYTITKPGKCAIYVDGNDSHGCSVKLAKIGYRTSGTWWDEALALPYPPTMNPENVLYWSLAGGDPETTYASLGLYQDIQEFVPFVANGLTQRCTPVVQLHGDGLTSPFIDGYQVRFPEKIVNYTPELFTIGHGQIQDFQIEDGPELDDQKFAVTIIDDGKDSRVSGLTRRGRIHGRLRVTETSIVENEEGEKSEQTVTTDLVRAMFVNPKRTSRKGLETITLSGFNYGAWKLAKSHFLWPSTYGGLTPSQALKMILRYCGFDDDAIDIDEDATLTLPETKLDDKGTDPQPGGEEGEEQPEPSEEAAQKSDFKSQPACGSSVREYVEQILANYTDGWGLTYGADGIWRSGPECGPDYIPAVSQGTILKDPSLAQVMKAEKPWYGDVVEEELTPPEANLIYMFGLTDAGVAIGNYAINSKSITCEGEKPLNYLGCIEPVVFFDPAINTQEVLDACLEHVANVVFRAHTMKTWHGPFNPRLKKGTRWTLEGIGDVVIRNVSTDGTSPRQLECTESTTYTGELINE